MWGYRNTRSSDPRVWLLEDALLARWYNDMKECYELLTRVCINEITEDTDEQEAETASPGCQ